MVQLANNFTTDDKTKALAADQGRKITVLKAIVKGGDQYKPPYLFFSSTKREFIRFIHYMVETKKEGWQNFEGADQIIMKATTIYSNRYEDNLVYKF